MALIHHSIAAEIIKRITNICLTTDTSTNDLLLRKIYFLIHRNKYVANVMQNVGILPFFDIN